MNSFSINKTKVNQKDIEKGQKIVAAIYLLTNHLPQNDTIRISLRTLAVSLVRHSFSNKIEVATEIEILLGAAVLSGLITDKNSSIVIYETKRFCENMNGEVEGSTVASLFAEDQTKLIEERHIKDFKKPDQNLKIKSQGHYNSDMSYTKNPLSKITREDKILAFINDRKSAVIKDITSLFPDVSEKTVQRELSKLIDTGRIIKRGNKRWSIYMAVNSLL
jgi:hypothetical protein